MMLCGCHGGYQLDGNVNVGEFDAEQDRGEPSRAKPRKREQDWSGPGLAEHHMLQSIVALIIVLQCLVFFMAGTGSS